MDSENNQEKARQPQQEGGSFSFKRVPHVMILPDGSKPVELGSGAVTALLGIGGMANVYEIWNNHLEMKRAVKLLHPNYSQDSKERFETEIKITAKLDHPNIVEIHAVGEWNGLPYIEMEKIEGVTLEKLVSDRGGLPFEVCTAIGIMVCRALRYAHSHEYALYGETYHGIIHRDLKPNNIMVSEGRHCQAHGLRHCAAHRRVHSHHRQLLGARQHAVSLAGDARRQDRRYPHRHLFPRRDICTSS